MNPSPSSQLAGASLKPKTNAIAEEYQIGKNVLGILIYLIEIHINLLIDIMEYLGLGISGKVVECFSLKTGKKYALKVISKVWNIFCYFHTKYWYNLSRFWGTTQKQEEKLNFIGEQAAIKT